MLTEKLNEIIKEWFDESNIDSDEKRRNYIVLCNYFEITLADRTYKCKQFKKLKKKFKKEIEKETHA